MEIVLVTGKVNSGKTELMKKLVEQESLKGNFPTGVIACSVFKDGGKIGFNVTDLSTRKSKPLARVSNEIKYGFSVGRFIFSNKSFDFAKKALLKFKPNGVVFLDEVGPLELKDKGYAECLKKLLDSEINRLYISVRNECLAKVMQKFLLSRQAKIIKTKSSIDDIWIEKERNNAIRINHSRR
jgi:nucleoside-triphosphatase THEP1